jgi:hypothetical protein
MISKELKLIAVEKSTHTLTSLYCAAVGCLFIRVTCTCQKVSLKIEKKKEQLSKGCCKKQGRKGINRI